MEGGGGGWAGWGGTKEGACWDEHGVSYGREESLNSTSETSMTLCV